MGQVTRQEWKWALAVAALTVALSSVPTIAGYCAQTPDLRFAGAVFDLEDYHSHLDKMWQGHRGEWRSQLSFTPEPHEGAYLRLFYAALGHLARLTHLSVPLTYHLARVAAGVILLLVVYRFVALFATGKTRQMAFLLAATSSGLGWLVEIVHRTPVGGISPIDFWLVDAYTFFSLFIFPHFSITIALLLCLFGLLIRLAEGVDTRLWRWLVATVLLSWGLGLIHPYALLLADLVPALYLAWRLVTARRLPAQLLVVLALLGLSQLPLLLYDAYVFTTSPVFRAWAAQNVTLSPPPLHYVLGYGLVLVLALWGIRPALRASRRTPFLLLWIAVSFTLAYLPWGLQRRFVEGVHVGLCVLAGYGLMEGLMPALARPLGRLARLARYDPSRLRWLIRASVIVLAALSNLYLVTTYTLTAASRSPALFHTADEVAAVEWLAAHTGWDETVLASYATGNWVVGTTGHRVFCGHWAETIDFSQKQAEAQAFYSTDETFERTAFLAGYGIAYVFHGPREREMGGFDPATAPYLEPVFHQGDVTVYRVVLEGGP